MQNEHPLAAAASGAPGHAAIGLVSIAATVAGASLGLYSRSLFLSALGIFVIMALAFVAATLNTLVAGLRAQNVAGFHWILHAVGVVVILVLLLVVFAGFVEARRLLALQLPPTDFEHNQITFDIKPTTSVLPGFENPNGDSALEYQAGLRSFWKSLIEGSTPKAKGKAIPGHKLILAKAQQSQLDGAMQYDVITGHINVLGGTILDGKAILVNKTAGITAIETQALTIQPFKVVTSADCSGSIVTSTNELHIVGAGKGKELWLYLTVSFQKGQTEFRVQMVVDRTN